MALTPIAVDGYFMAGHGLSAMGSGLLRACDAVGIPALPARVEDLRIAGFAPADLTAAVAPELAPLPFRVDATTPELLAHRIARGTAPEATVRAGLWAWEVEDWFIPGWEAGFAYVEEVWTLSEHAAAALRRVAGDVPVHVIGLPVAMPVVHPRPRAVLGLPEGFLFLASFDLASSLERKNPFGTIEAFARAFPPGAGASLLLKTTSGDFVPERLDALRAAAARHRDVHVVDGRIPERARDELLASCDCYLSLHRAEGLGLGMAEAMALGKPVIATAYSGNLDFMDDASAYLVGWERTAVPPGTLYAGGTWAEPDLGHAAELMREVHGAPDAAAARGLLATHRIAATLAPAVVGARVHARVSELAARLPDPAAPSDPLVATLLGVLARQRTDGEAATYALAGAEAAQRHAADATVRVHRLAAGDGFGHRPHPVAGVVQTYGGSGEGGPYVALERAFRGDAETIRARQRWYLPLLEGAAPVLDAGCGRGELLDLLAEAGIAARGVDADAGMAASCRARGLDVSYGDALDAIDGVGAGELGAIFCAHVVEHLDGAQIERLLLGAHAALRPGGLLVLETPNAYFPLWLRLFWIDPTHRRPVPPEALLAMLAGAGFADAFHTHPNGSGHVEVDRFNQPDCAVIATKGRA